MTEEAKRGPGRPPKAADAPEAPIATVLCRVLRDYWPAEDERVHAGTIVELPVSEALDGIEEGRMERVK